MIKDFCIKDAIKFGKIGEHLVVADLLMNGYDAFIVPDHNSSFDVVMNNGKSLLKVQVKTTTKPSLNRNPSKIKNILAQTPCYKFNIKDKGNGLKSCYSENDVDMFALVCLDTRFVAYIPYSARTGNISFRDPKMKGKYWNERWMTYRPIIEKYKLEGKTYSEIGRILNMDWSTVAAYMRPDRKSRKSVNDGYYIDEFTLDRCIDFINTHDKIKTSNLLELYYNNYINISQ